MPRPELKPVGAYGTKGSFDFNKSKEMNIGSEEEPDIRTVYQASISVTAEGVLDQGGQTVLDNPGTAKVLLKTSQGKDYRLSPWTVTDMAKALPNAFLEASKMIKDNYGTGSPDYKKVSVKDTETSL